jgi:hypothetical protein
VLRKLLVTEMEILQHPPHPLQVLGRDQWSAERKRQGHDDAVRFYFWLQSYSLSHSWWSVRSLQRGASSTGSTERS